MKECICCDNKLGFKKQRYCSDECAKKYRSGIILVGKGGIKNRFKNAGYTLKMIIKEAEQQGHEYVTVRFDN